ncbi:MAG: PilN domain-containing protein [Candidatus Berkelbacteria bacterium]
MPGENEHGARVEEPFLEINTSEDEGGGAANIVFVSSIILVVLITGFFIFYKYRTDSEVKDKQQALNSVMDQINSSENKAITVKAQNLNSALGILTVASKSKYSFKTFIDALKTKITKDTKLNSISISDAGLVSMDGITTNFRSVADLAVALGASPKLKNVQIVGLTKSDDESSSLVGFSMTAEIKDWSTASSADSNTDSADSAGSVGGASE